MACNFIEETPTKVFYYEVRKISKNNYFERLRMAASYLHKAIK